MSDIKTGGTNGCGCVAQIEADAAARMRDEGRFKKPVKRVSMQGVVIRFTNDPDVNAVTANTLEIELEGQKKKVTMSMLHSFCPFCGRKIGGDQNGGAA